MKSSITPSHETQGKENLNSIFIYVIADGSNQKSWINNNSTKKVEYITHATHDVSTLILYDQNKKLEMQML